MLVKIYLLIYIYETKNNSQKIQNRIKSKRVIDAIKEQQNKSELNRKHESSYVMVSSWWLEIFPYQDNQHLQSEVLLFSLFFNIVVR